MWDHLVDRWGQDYSLGLGWGISFILPRTAAMTWLPLWLNFSDPMFLFLYAVMDRL